MDRFRFRHDGRSFEAELLPPRGRMVTRGADEGGEPEGPRWAVMIDDRGPFATDFPATFIDAEGDVMPRIITWYESRRAADPQFPGGSVNA